MVGIKAHGKGVMISILRNGNEVRDAEPYFARLTTKKPDTQPIALARELIERAAAFSLRKCRMNMPAQFASS
jgi:non-homologous end joining protein Ku